MLLNDGASEFTGWSTEFVKHARRMCTQIRNSEQGRHNYNHTVDRDIGFFAIRWRMQMTKKVIPKWLWYFGLFYKTELLSRMSRGKDKRTGYEDVTGQTPYIGD